MNEIDDNIRDQIIIPDNKSKFDFENLSNIELAVRFSKNKNNLDIFEKLLLKTDIKNDIINEILIKVLVYEDTASIDAIKLLINYGADVNHKDSEGWSVFSYCCINPINSIELTELLIENRAKINSKNKFGRIPLIHLVKYSKNHDDLEIIKLLIRKGSKINHKDDLNETVLIKCFENNNNVLIRYDIIKILLDNKADIYIKNYENYNILDILKRKITNDKQSDEYSDIYSLIFNYKNIDNDHYCEFDVNFIYNFFNIT